jgi:glycosyltransferase involved in cell wall biosynthesis
MNLFVTSDRIGAPSGGGLVTHQEHLALSGLGELKTYGRDQIPGGPTVWSDDDWVCSNVSEHPKLAHFYAGTFSRFVNFLKGRGAKVTYTAAAHSIGESRAAHQELGLPFEYPHLTEPSLWRRYVQGYLSADKVICPSRLSAEVMKGYGVKDVTVIPHGVDFDPAEPPVPPERFTLGYLGAIGPDKGLATLLRAWKMLGYRDASLKIAGAHSASQFVSRLLEVVGGGNVELVGWVASPARFYEGLSAYVQPSRSEGFGIEVLEAMERGRVAIASKGAGASELVPLGFTFAAKSVEELAAQIDRAKTAGRDSLARWGALMRKESADYTWDKIRARYQELWRQML